MKRVMVIGCPGGGKSTFSRTLHQVTGIPLFHLDMLNWNPDRTTVDKAVFLDRLNEVLLRNEWIIDGNYGSTIELRMRECDTVFFLDYPLEVCLSGIRDRRGKERPDMPWVEPEDETDIEFLEFVQNFTAKSRPQILSLLEKYAEKEIHVFRTRDEAEEFIEKVKNEK